MSGEVLRRYCPSANLIGPACLNGWQLTFPVYLYGSRGGGAASIVPCSLSQVSETERTNRISIEEPVTPVWGALWDIAVSELHALDSWEGYSADRPLSQNSYIRVLIEGLLVAGGLLASGAHAYVAANHTNRFLMPSSYYLGKFIAGAKECGLPEEYLLRVQDWLEGKRLASLQFDHRDEDS